MTTDKMKQMIERLADEVWNLGELGALDEMLAPDYLGHSTSRPDEDYAGFVAYIPALRAAFPDFHLTIDDLVAEGDRAVKQWTATGTQQGEFSGIPATGRAVSITGMTLYRFAGGKVAEAWDYPDTLGLLTQLGVLPQAEPG